MTDSNDIEKQSLPILDRHPRPWVLSYDKKEIFDLKGNYVVSDERGYAFSVEVGELIVDAVNEYQRSIERDR